MSSNDATGQASALHYLTLLYLLHKVSRTVSIQKKHLDQQQVLTIRKFDQVRVQTTEKVPDDYVKADRDMSATCSARCCFCNNNESVYLWLAAGSPCFKMLNLAYGARVPGVAADAT